MSPSDFQPIFLVGCPRSGTSVTKKVLRGHPGLASCGVEHHYILELADHFGDRRFGMAEGFEFFATSGFSFASELSKEAAECAATSDRHVNVSEFCASMWQLALGEGQGGPLLLQYAGVGLLRWHDLAELFPAARFVVLTRDPRANVSSQVNSFGHGRTVNRSVNLWKQCIAASRDLSLRQPAESLQVSYESLVRAPDEALRSMIEFMGLDWDEHLVDFEVAMSVANVGGEVEHRTFSEFDAGMLDKWRSGLTPPQISFIEWRCRDEMETLGYEATGRRIRPADLPALIVDVTRWNLHRVRARLGRG